MIHLRKKQDNLKHTDLYSYDLLINENILSTEVYIDKQGIINNDEPIRVEVEQLFPEVILALPEKIKIHILKDFQNTGLQLEDFTRIQDYIYLSFFTNKEIFQTTGLQSVDFLDKLSRIQTIDSHFAILEDTLVDSNKMELSIAYFDKAKSFQTIEEFFKLATSKFSEILNLLQRKYVFEDILAKISTSEQFSSHVVKKFIAKNNIDEALNILSILNQIQKLGLEQQIIMLKNRVAHLRNRIIKGLCTNEEAAVFENRIADSILLLIGNE